MAEPVDVSADLKETRGIIRTVSVKVYNSATDAHAAATTCQGFRSEKRVGVVSVTDGGQVVQTLADWTLTDLATRPVQRSLIVDPDTSEEWVVDRVKEHEPREVWDLETHLA